MNYHLQIIRVLYLAYGISTILFLIASAFSKMLKTFKTEYLKTTNLLALSIAITEITRLILQLTGNYEIYSTEQKGFYLVLLAFQLFPLIFLSKRVRQNVIITLLMIAFLNWYIIFQSLVRLINIVYSDYVASPWTTSYYNKNDSILLLSISYFVITFMIARFRHRYLAAHSKNVKGGI